MSVNKKGNKGFQVWMQPEDHRELKVLAGQCGLTIGETIRALFVNGADQLRGDSDSSPVIESGFVPIEEGGDKFVPPGFVAVSRTWERRCF